MKDSQKRLEMTKSSKPISKSQASIEIAKKLIEMAMANTKLVGDLILKDLKAGKSDEAIIKAMGDYFTDSLKAPLDKYELQSNVSGFIHYYRKKKLV